MSSSASSSGSARNRFRPRSSAATKIRGAHRSRTAYLSLMDWRTECAAVIPCLNEQASIGPLVQAVRRWLPTVIVVDDGSNDATASLAREAGAEVLRHEV